MEQSWLNSSLIKIQDDDWSGLTEGIFQFMEGIESRVEAIMSSDKEIRRLPLENVGWLTNFPAGIC